MHPMKILSRVVIIGFLLTFFLFGLLIFLGHEKSTLESAPGKKSITDTIVDGWEILIPPRDRLSQNQPTTVDDSGLVQCSYQWAVQPLPDVSLEIQDAFKEAGYNEVFVSAEAFGENCIHPETGQTIKFLTMQTDIDIRSPIESVNEKEKIGNKLVEYILVLREIPVESIPGSQPGQVRVSFIGQDDEFNLWFPYQQGLQAVNEGLSGVDLVEALGN